MTKRKIPSTPSEIRTYRRAVEDGQDTLREVYRSISSLEQKGWRIVRVNTLVTTIVLSFLSVTSSFQNIRIEILAIIFASILVLIISSGWGVVMQKQRPAKIGAGSSILQVAAENTHEEHYYLDRALDMYVDSISDAKERNRRMATYLDAAVYTSVFGILLMVMALVLLIVI